MCMGWEGLATLSSLWGAVREGVGDEAKDGAGVDGAGDGAEGGCEAVAGCTVAGAVAGI